MGFHIINIKGEKIEHQFIENQNELMYREDIKSDTIIYQGEEHWTPIRVGDSEIYKNYCKDYFRAGLKAQELFKTQAKANGFMLEELYQDKESFQQYLVTQEFINIKRGDFLIRNFGNIEIDVKCRSFYGKKGKETFNFRCEDVEKHLNMQKLTNTPVVLAIYRRKGSNVIGDAPYFISINTINEHKESFNVHHEEKDNTGNCYQIPITLTINSFDFIRNFIIN